MSTLAIIGGTGLDSLHLIEEVQREQVETPFGQTSAPVIRGRLFGTDVFFLARHGEQHHLPPHEINYRANLWALQQLGAEEILAIAAVGGIGPTMSPSQLVLPDQIIDYTWGRKHTYFDAHADEVQHVDFTWPYCHQLRQRLLQAAQNAGVTLLDGGTYGATQGPRLETTAEIKRLEQDGCDLVGMTGMPEAALARELDLCYATCAIVANWAAGKGEGEITMPEIEANLSDGLTSLVKILESLLT